MIDNTNNDNYPSDLHFLANTTFSNDPDYEIIEFIRNIIIPQVYQTYNYIRDTSDFYHKMVILMFREHQCTFKDIFNGISVHLIYNNDQSYDFDTIMNYVKNAIIESYFSELDGRVEQVFPSQIVQPLSEPVKLIVSETELETVTQLEYEKVEEDIKLINKTCSICQCDFETSDKVRITKCRHVFHMDCVDKWFLEDSYKCPICRATVAKYEAKF
jgi:hypothetical protein